MRPLPTLSHRCFDPDDVSSTQDRLESQRLTIARHRSRSRECQHDITNAESATDDGRESCHRGGSKPVQPGHPSPARSSGSFTTQLESVARSEPVAPAAVYEELPTMFARGSSRTSVVPITPSRSARSGLTRASTRTPINTPSRCRARSSALSVVPIEPSA